MIRTPEPIGHIRTGYTALSQTPRQPAATVGTTVGVITLAPGRDFEQALADLDGFDRIWIVSWFDHVRGWKPKVLPPREQTKRGLFATRSPHRPNPIGISCCRLLDIRGRTLRVENPDLLDGTPVLDIKPYIPSADSFQDARIGWLGERIHQPHHTVNVLPTARQQDSWLKRYHNIDILSRAVPTLEISPRTHPYRRTRLHPDGTGILAVQSWRVLYRVRANRVQIHRLRSGYSVEAARTGKNADSRKAHIGFHKKWPERTSRK